MDGEISFGEFRESQPDPGLRPDRNPQWDVQWVGQGEDRFGVFIELDVMRELESHARGNLNIELGGVLLGDQLVDEHGRPFVVVRDSLRAEHYEATRGSFKFTHQTWEAITRQLETFPQKPSIVGWYHTHPGWGVFLSDMDLFICNHFFSRPLDVALVIDPLRDELGWFAWSDDPDKRSQRRLSRFGLFGHRHRREELELVVQRYNESETMPTDPRLRISSSAPASAVTIVERQSALAMWIVMGALVLGQLTLAASLVWRGDRGPQALAPTATDATQLDLIVRERQAQARTEMLRELLVATVEKSPESVGMVDRLTLLNENNQALRSNVEGQAALNRELQQQLGQSNEQLDRLSAVHRQLNEKLERTESQISDLRAQVKSAETNADGSAGTTLATWVLVAMGAAIAFLAAAAGIVAGFWFAVSRNDLAARDSSQLEAKRAISNDESNMKLA
jgi:proteasome lid subunit RPN8/RPN11